MDNYCTNCDAEITDSNPGRRCGLCGVEHCAGCRACECETTLAEVTTSATPIFNVKRPARSYP